MKEPETVEEAREDAKDTEQMAIDVQEGKISPHEMVKELEVDDEEEKKE